MITYEQSRQGYLNLWRKMEVQPGRIKASNNLAETIVHLRSRYFVIQQQTSVPWWFIGLLHMRESSFNFGTYLGDGSNLAGRWASFADGAHAALAHEGFVGVKDWPVSYQLWASEKWNGQGYFALPHVNSPYLWSWSNLYVRGKYRHDGPGGFDASFVDPQPGVAPVLASLIAISPEVAEYVASFKEGITVDEIKIPPTPPLTGGPVRPTMPSVGPQLPVPMPPAQTQPTDLASALIAILKSTGSLPAAPPPTPPATVDITVTGNVTVTINGVLVAQGE